MIKRSPTVIRLSGEERELAEELIRELGFSAMADVVRFALHELALQRGISKKRV